MVCLATLSMGPRYLVPEQVDALLVLVLCLTGWILLALPGSTYLTISSAVRFVTFSSSWIHNLDLSHFRNILGVFLYSKLTKIILRGLNSIKI